MSEEILKALMQLFAIIAKLGEAVSKEDRNYVVKFLTQQLGESNISEYLTKFDDYAEITIDEYGEIKSKADAESRISVRDSVRTLMICRKINKQLSQKQKVVVLVRLYEMIDSRDKFTESRKEILNSVSNVFNISFEENKAIEDFILEENVSVINDSNIIISNNEINSCGNNCKHILQEKLDGSILIIRINSVDLYFIKYRGNDTLYLNGLVLKPCITYLFAQGSVIKVPKGNPIFYSDIVDKFIKENAHENFVFEVNNVCYKFSNGSIGLDNISIIENSGRLVGIMGVSGAGKTTLLNVLAGIEKPSCGNVLFNGTDIHKENKLLKGVLGYIPQDDLLIEDLTVYQNLFYTAKLCLNNISEQEINEKVIETLKDLNLLHIQHLKVGNVMNKKISGGQRKRLNIALELIREPSVLFVDEPTSGLSSRDSENVMQLLRELALKGKLIFVVIHQPASVIYKMFDSMMFLDVGGCLIYYGNPIEAIMYFKQKDKQINSDVGECFNCGNVDSESIFNIIEAEIIDEYGLSVGIRKTKPKEWNEWFLQNYKLPKIESSINKISKTYTLPSKLTQFKNFFRRDVISKLNNLQYILINILEAPVLATILAVIIKYISDPSSNVYIYRENENIAPYMFMSIVVALFIGLTVSSEEIFKDRLILKREALLNLSRGSYLFSKVSILVMLSALQTITFVLLGNSILGIKGMYLDYWLLLFTVSVCANMIGLNISSALNSAVAIYILIPLLIIPQMILGGAMFSYDKLNSLIGGGKQKTPIIANFMPSRWAYEAIIVKQFIYNDYEKNFYNVDKKRSMSNYKTVYFIPELTKIVDGYTERVAFEKYVSNINTINISIKDDIELLKNEINNELVLTSEKVNFSFIDSINVKSFNPRIAKITKKYLENLNNFYREEYSNSTSNRDNIIQSLIENKEISYKNLFDIYYNENVSRLVKNTLDNKKMYRSGNKLVRKTEPIYYIDNDTYLGLDTHFYSPFKKVFNFEMQTYFYNIAVLWLISIFLYIALYFKWLKKLVEIDFGKKLFRNYFKFSA